MQRILLLIAGWLAMGLATLGIILPLLPTTPFLLLAAWCFARSSPRFHYWLLNRSVFGRYLRHWQQYQAVPPGTKGRAIVITLLAFAVSLWLVKIVWVRLLLICMLSVLILFMLRLPVVDEGQQKP